MEMDAVLYEQSNQTIFVMETQHHRLIHVLLAQLDYRQILQKHRVLQLAETANERVLKLTMTEIRRVETDVVQAVLLKLEQSEMEELHHHLMYAIFALQVFTQTQGALFVSHIVETAREQVQRLVMTVTQAMEMDAVLYVLSSQTLFEVEDQYHLQIRVQHALPDYKEYGQGTYYTKNGDKYTGQ